ncbi:MAG TPA: rhodanese-like domain-containing protein [Nitrospirae bacterium]|nr:rhodanese-like domain-containing protein [Nitrospirota bacterium]
MAAKIRKFTRRRLIFTLLAFCAAIIVAPSFTLAHEASSITNVTPEKAKELIGNKKIDLILDVRTPGEYTGPTGNIAGSKLIPVQNLAERIGEIKDYKDKTVLVYCHSGVRSARSAKILESSGFKNIINMEGGIMGWKGKGYKTTK